MTIINEGKLTFTFPPNWQVSKFDEWSFYRNQFGEISAAGIHCSQCGREIRCAGCGNRHVSGTKAVDLLAIDVQKCFWCIEIKDYRQHRREKTIDLADEVAVKVRDTLAALAAARLRANESEERIMAANAMQSVSLRIVLHLEQPAKHSKLFPRALNPANVRLRLRKLVKAIDPHPLVVEMNEMEGLAWSVT